VTEKEEICQAESWDTLTCPEGHIHLVGYIAGLPAFEFVLKSDEAYRMAQQLLKIYDVIEGIK
jgi:hypothetical protein